MKNWKGLIILVAYIATIPFANFVVGRFGFVPVGFGLLAPAAVYIVGASFTLRDLAQDALGRWPIVLGIVLGGLLSFLIAPQFALASATAFLISEGLDFAIYTPLRESGRWLRAVALSNTVGLLADSILFLWLAFGSLEFLPGQVLGKAYMTLLAVAVLFPIRQRRFA